MRKLTIAIAVLVSASLFINASCRRSGNNTSCNGAVCTQIFASVAIQVKDMNSQPVILDEVYTVRQKTGEKINPQQNMADGYYTLLDDSYQTRIANSSESFRFIGIKNGVQIVEESYTISADCCHVKKVSGRDSIVVNP